MKSFAMARRYPVGKLQQFKKPGKSLLDYIP
jgi:hypothetical protein